MESYLGDTSLGQVLPPGMVDWLLRVANEARAERAGWGQMIDRHLRSHATSIEWRRSRPALKDTPHFSRYRSQGHRLRYDVAVRALGHGVGSAVEYERVTALSAEIAKSPLVLRSGQVLLSGEVDATSLAFARYNPFLWATVHPISAAISAETVLVPKVNQAKPTVYVLRLERSLPALLGRRGPYRDWDVLLPRRLRISVTSTHEGRRFNVREGSLGL